MKANQAEFPVRVKCRVLGVSPSGYYDWRDRGPSARAVADAALTERIKASHLASRYTYGSPRIHTDLAEEGYCVGRKRIARLMRLAGLEGVSRRRRCRTTRRDKTAQPVPDLVDRNFVAEGKDGWRFSTSSRPSTTRIAVIPGWATCHPSTMRGRAVSKRHDPKS